jgi:hypothetical protein
MLISKSESDYLNGLVTSFVMESLLKKNSKEEMELQRNDTDKKRILD